MEPSVADAVCAAVFSQLGRPRPAPGLAPACPGELQRAVFSQLGRPRPAPGLAPACPGELQRALESAIASAQLGRPRPAPGLSPVCPEELQRAVFSQLGRPRPAPGLAPACPGELQRALESAVAGAQRAGTAAPMARLRHRRVHAASAGPRVFRPASWATSLSLSTQRREPAFSFGRLERSASPDVRRATAQGSPRV